MKENTKKVLQSLPLVKAEENWTMWTSGRARGMKTVDLTRSTPSLSKDDRQTMNKADQIRDRIIRNQKKLIKVLTLANARQSKELLALRLHSRLKEAA